MSEVKSPAKGGAAALSKVLYVIAALLAIVFIYMIYYNVTYMQSYLELYGMEFSDMATDAVQYVLAGSVSYLAYAVLVFCAGKIIAMLSLNARRGVAGEVVAEEESAAEETAEVVAEEELSADEKVEEAEGAPVEAGEEKSAEESVIKIVSAPRVQRKRRRRSL